MRIFLFLLFLPGVLQAGNDPLVDLFESHYNNHYVSGKCGDNVRRFLEAATRLGLADDLHVIKIENKGYSMFGMVNAEKSRDVRFNKPALDENNWYFHAIVLDGKGRVYDFDYLISPTIELFENYIEEMFLDEPECSGPKNGRFCIGRETKLKEYQLHSVPSARFLGEGFKPNRKGVWLQEALEDFECLLH